MLLDFLDAYLALSSQDDFSPTSKLQRLLAESRQMVTDLELSTLLPISSESASSTAKKVRLPLSTLRVVLYLSAALSPCAPVSGRAVNEALSLSLREGAVHWYFVVLVFVCVFFLSTLVLRKKKSYSNVTAPKLPLSNYLGIEKKILGD